MKKCCFVIPYFGKLPNYFQLFLNSCKYNEGFEWLIITDDKSVFDYPSNVKTVFCSFEDLKLKIQSHYDFKISLEKPYKLCDFRPAYGEIFEEYLTDFEFWGYCDTDILIGDLNHFLTADILSRYDKLFCLGHMALFRNKKEDLQLYKTAVNNELWYVEAFSSPENIIFDENCKSGKNIHKIYKYLGKKILEVDWSINFKILPTRFVKITFIPETGNFEEDGQSAVYTWEKGKVYRYTFKEHVIKEEFLYIHLQERKMKMKSNVSSLDKVKIVPNTFEELEVPEVSNSTFAKIKKYAFNFHYFEYHYKWKKKRMKELLRIK